jgi:hypothetical protein
MGDIVGRILFAMANIRGCNHHNSSIPISDRGGVGPCRIICLDCGATALYSPYRFVRTGPWEKEVVQTNRSEIIPHVYSTC